MFFLINFSRFFALLTILITITQTLSLPFPNPIQILSRDFQALTRKVTAHHILLPKSLDVALALKQKIRNAASPTKSSNETPMYIVDAFRIAATKYSQDGETASNGGLLGKLVPQGYCRAPELDKACFEVPLGEIVGPIESSYGYHLLLVVERTNCPKLDRGYNAIRKGEDGVSKVFELNTEYLGEMSNFALQQVGFWILVTVAGGIVAEIAAQASNIVDTLPWQ